MINRAAVKTVVKMLQSITAARMAGSKGFKAFDPCSGLNEDASSGFVPMIVMMVVRLCILCSTKFTLEITRSLDTPRYRCESPQDRLWNQNRNLKNRGM